MKRLFLFVLLLFFSFQVYAVSFLSYNHDATWNDTTEQGTGAGNGWTCDGGSVSYSSSQAANGSNSVLVPQCTNGYYNHDLSGASLVPSSGNWNLTLKLYVPSTSPTGGGSASFGISNNTDASDQGCLEGAAKNLCVGYKSGNGNWRIHSSTGDEDSGIALTTGWHTVEFRVTGHTAAIAYIDGTQVKSVSGYSAFRKIGGYNYNMDQDPYLDDLHIWNDTLSPNLTITALNCTSCDPPSGDTVPPYTTFDTTPTFTFTTNMNTNCRIGVQDSNYTTFGSSRNCTSTGSTSHTCTVISVDEFTASAGNVFVGCSAYENISSSTGALVMNITDLLVNTSLAIDRGVIASTISSGAVTYDDRKVYLRSANNTRVVATVDRVVTYGSQYWLFHYVNEGESATAIFNMTPAVYVLQLSNLTFDQITFQVSSFINSTKI